MEYLRWIVNILIYKYLIKYLAITFKIKNPWKIWQKHYVHQGCTILAYISPIHDNITNSIIVIVTETISELFSFQIHTIMPLAYYKRK